jgi:hypothetical protein
MSSWACLLLVRVEHLVDGQAEEPAIANASGSDGRYRPLSMEITVTESQDGQVVIVVRYIKADT